MSETLAFFIDKLFHEQASKEYEKDHDVSTNYKPGVVNITMSITSVKLTIAKIAIDFVNSFIIEFIKNI